MFKNLVEIGDFEKKPFEFINDFIYPIFCYIEEFVSMIPELNNKENFSKIKEIIENYW